MEIMEIIKQRNSVRQYLPKTIEEDLRCVLDDLILKCNLESGLNIQIFYDEEHCFNNFLAHYGKFRGVNNYLSIVGKKKDADLLIKAGYYGELIVLKAQELGLNSCWVALSHGKSKANISKDEKEVIIIALGYGENQGVSHKSKPAESFCKQYSLLPENLKLGIVASTYAPTALNQQKFYFEYENGMVLKTKKGIYTHIDLGIVKYHFQACSGTKINVIR